MTLAGCEALWGKNLKTLFLDLDSPIPEEQIFQHFQNKTENMEGASNSKNTLFQSDLVDYWINLRAAIIDAPQNCCR